MSSASGDGAKVPSRPEVTENRKWQAMTVTDLGSMREVVRGGGGKLSVVAVDMGDSRKPPGHGG